MDRYELKKELDLGEKVWVAIPWAGVSEDGRKEQWHEKGRVVSLDGSSAVVKLDNGGSLTVMLKHLQPWHDSMAQRRTVR
jgi:hypothetical protein